MQAGVAIRLINEEGLMGTVATRAFKTGETIIALPEGLAVALLSLEYTAAVRCCFSLYSLASQGAAVALTRMQPAGADVRFNGAAAPACGLVGLPGALLGQPARARAGAARAELP